MGQLDGRIAVVTGCSLGIGLAAAQALVAQGAFVYITGRRQAELDHAVALMGGNAKGIVADVAVPGDMDRLYALIAGEQKRIDTVFANAGMGAMAPLGSLTLDHIDQFFAVNVKGVILTVQGALPLMREGGSIILNASIVASKGFAAWSVYSATKAAVRSFARTWSADLKGRGIRVNAISPGVIPTPGYTTIGLSPAEFDAFFAQCAEQTPLGRNGTAQEVARVVTFLAGDDGSFVTASEIFIDGGIAQI